jgi:glucokinase
MPSPNPRDRSPRSKRPSRPGPTGPLALGIDLGATKVVAVLIDAAGNVVRRGVRQPHRNDGASAVIAAVVHAAREFLRTGTDLPTSVGISVAAQVDPDRGWVLYAPNLRWREVPLGPRVARALKLPVRVTNDARAATYAEWLYGSGVGCSDLFCIQLGTGVGGSAVMGGQLAEGGNHAAGEVGHIVLVSGGRPCHCPDRGCFEAYVGGWAIAARARDAVRADPGAGRRLTAAAGSVAAIRAETVFRTARAGDRLARRIVAETDRYLGDGVVSVANAFNPRRLVLGGGLVNGRPEFVRVAQAAVRDRCQPPAAGARVVASRLGDLAPAIGAAALAARQ